MQAQNQFAVAQLKDEIRLLHQKIQAGRRSAAPAVETWNRQEVESRIDEMLKQNTSFCLVLIVLKNLKPLTSRYSGAAVEDALQALQVRLRDPLGGASMLGRWTANQFVAILNVAPSRAMAASRDAAQKIAEPYSFTHKGIPSTLVFQVAAGVVDYQDGSDALKFQTQVGQPVGGTGRRPALIRRGFRLHQPVLKRLQASADRLYVIVLLALLLAQDVRSQADRIRAAMEPSLAKQRASVRAQIEAAASHSTSPPSSTSWSIPYDHARGRWL